jgi:hypothetical protein
MDRLMEQMAQIAPVKTTAWGGLHGSLALVLNNWNYATVTKNIVTSLAPLTKPTTINPNINKLSNPYVILTLQDEMKTLQKEFELQEAVTTILKRVPLLIATWRSRMVCVSLSAGIPGLELLETFMRGLLLSPNVQPPSWALLFSSQIVLNVFYRRKD